MIKNLVLIGPPGAGKGTLSRYLVNKYAYQYFCVGELFRSEIAAKTTFGQEVSHYLAHGQLVPDHVTNHFVESLFPVGNRAPFILDGYPRTLNQCQFFYQLQTKLNFDQLLVLVLNIDHETMLTRVVSRKICPNCHAIFNDQTSPSKKVNICDVCQSQLQHRNDDNPATLKQRLEVYEQQKAAMLTFFKAKQYQIVELSTMANKAQLLTSLDQIIQVEHV